MRVLVAVARSEVIWWTANFPYLMIERYKDGWLAGLQKYKIQKQYSNDPQEVMKAWWQSVLMQLQVIPVSVAAAYLGLYDFCFIETGAFPAWYCAQSRERVGKASLCVALQAEAAGAVCVLQPRRGRPLLLDPPLPAPSVVDEARAQGAPLAPRPLQRGRRAGALVRSALQLPAAHRAPAAHRRLVRFSTVALACTWPAPAHESR